MSDAEIVSAELVSRELPCVRCNYDLRTLPLAGVCPECGTPIRASLPPAGFRFASARDALAVCRGIAILIVAMMLSWSATLVLFVTFRYASFTAPRPILRAIYRYAWGTLSSAAAIVAVGGAIAVLATLRRSNVIPRPGIRLAHTLAAMAVAGVIGAEVAGQSVTTPSLWLRALLYALRGALPALYLLVWLGLIAALDRQRTSWLLLAMRVGLVACTLLAGAYWIMDAFTFIEWPWSMFLGKRLQYAVDWLSPWRPSLELGPPWGTVHANLGLLSMFYPLLTMPLLLALGAYVHRISTATSALRSP
ncbi:MAG: hypothetical protein CHACPFDD_00244 [Phycisphaerae bacterium]|nr:hypothetical protein [Phycisphaerae bacterium]